MKSKSYIIRNYKVSATTYQFIQSKIGTLSPEQRRFFLHVLCSHLLDLQRKRYEDVPGYDVLGVKIPSVTIKSEFERGFSWERDGKTLSPFMQASDYCKGECRYFLVDPNLLDQVLATIRQSLLAPDKAPAVNVFDGQAYNLSEAMTGATALPSSKLIRDAARVLHSTRCPINVRAIQRHLDQLQAEGRLLKLRNDKMCAYSMFAGMDLADGVGHYSPAYSPQSSGRIGELGGGVQSCSRTMKQAAFSGMDGICNYDLRSSQGYVLLQELRLAGLDDTWVSAHLGPGAFEARAQELGLPKATYKTCFFSTIMGASHIWLDGEHVGAVQEAVLEHVPDSEAGRAKFDQVTEQLRPLKRIVGQWTSWLLDDEGCPHRKLTQRREFIENAAGQKLVLDRARPKKDLRGEAAAHILQGQEAAYIHHLTLLASEFGFTALSNQHDGLITLGEVPLAAQKRAAELSGFEHAFLEEKAFA